MATLRLILVFLSLAIFMAWGRVGGLFLRTNPSAHYAWRNRVTQSLAKTILRILRIRIVVEGHPPSGSFLLVSNHLGYLDIVILESLCPAFFISKKEVATWPFIGWVVRSTNTLFVDRGNARDLLRVNELMEDALAAQRSVVFFPEGTSTDGSHVRSFMPSLLETAARLQKPVHAVGLRYETLPPDPPASLSMCWWGDMDFFPHLKALARCRTGTAHVCFVAQPITHAHRKALATGLHTAVQEACGLSSGSHIP